MMDLDESVLLLVKKIPQGRVSTYKELAKALGSPGLARAVGNALNRNKMPVKIPCHRIVLSNGKVGGYNLGVERKISLLESEGVHVVDGRIKDLDNILFRFDQ